MRIREATADDRDVVRGIVSDALAEFGLAMDADGTDADLADLPASYHERGGVFRVVIDDAQAIIGCGGLYPHSAEVVELRKMYFRPASRGRGMGRRLLADLIAESRRLGFQRIELETSSRLTAALELYRSAGFIETDAPRHAARCDLTLALQL